jgi:hypothetical protein
LVENAVALLHNPASSKHDSNQLEPVNLAGLLAVSRECGSSLEGVEPQTLCN